MTILLFLAPFSVGLGLLAVAAFWWTLRDGQYDDPAGDANRILLDDPDDRPEA
ncbi:cbb3-type cytochrome oxidase assembly protein CcoS [Phenylobacterium sp. J367]|uniref:cbb3-type cytochrome oxidase assembly protein CcoS n=1 Tax=Phenylobacterium sp. J367 TaxID=2898435 RepID=UPI0021509025|nr:cbb3-type cytochrome oxidase assembly protein CcoS [Phenylobacterium sp. J367]MCR5881047.1 cbb3-type cytochrome oxidase assembly protein CcoS [Phenylobacterium sp. J367]